MTTSFIWHDLKQLMILDYRINQLRTGSLKEHVALTNAQVALKKKASLLSETEAALRAAQKEIDRYELTSKDLKNQLQRKNNQLAGIIHTKERIALEHEIAKLANNFDETDTLIMRTLEQYDLIKQSLDKQKSELGIEAMEVAALESTTTQRNSDKETEIKQLEAEWKTTLESVPLQLRNDYIQLKKRVANPAVPIVSDSCSACFLNLLQNESSHLSTRSVIKCRGCFRFLYVPDATTETPRV
jgi:predicted  nucleic acid-binding Zn-ribbon protein